MLKARFLGFSPDSGDDFTYVILTEPDDPNEACQVYTRSVIHSRHVQEDPPVVLRTDRKFEIYKMLIAGFVTLRGK